jgi:hypothetical protein
MRHFIITGRSSILIAVALDFRRPHLRSFLISRYSSAPLSLFDSRFAASFSLIHPSFPTSKPLQISRFSFASDHFAPTLSQSKSLILQCPVKKE